MTVEELRRLLSDLIEKCVSDELVKKHLLDLVTRDELPLKEILIELTPFALGRLSEEDRKAIGDMAFYDSR
ncbi:hypothetical protein [Paraburkholderia sp. J12]|uniref:hypothetical protein n=1 Tax=Paraburkholderia sp. J12 TaxID=2805432 RepID=UPI002ABDB021|nr:hypothetical protein [Paraburkholderia sp. J12]